MDGYRLNYRFQTIAGGLIASGKKNAKADNTKTT
jgi:hypothetical protein